MPKSVGALLVPPDSETDAIMLTAGLRRWKNGLFSGSLEVSFQASDGDDWVKGILCEKIMKERKQKRVIGFETKGSNSPWWRQDGIRKVMRLPVRVPSNLLGENSFSRVSAKEPDMGSKNPRSKSPEGRFPCCYGELSWSQTENQRGSGRWHREIKGGSSERTGSEG